MNLGMFKNVFNSIGDFTKKHAPEILAGIGIGGFITTAVLAAKATPDAMELVEEAKDEKQTEELTVFETVKAGYKPYLPAIFTGVSSTICVIGSVSTSLRRNAALATTYEITRNFAEEYRKKVIEEVGAKKEQKIRENLAQEQIDKNPPVTNVNVIAPKEDGTHKILFYEPFTLRYFWADRNKVETVINKCFVEIKNSFENQYSVYRLLELFKEYGIDLMEGLPDGEVDRCMDFGWPASSMNSDSLMEMSLVNGGTVHGGEWDGYPCIKIEYSEWPDNNFRSPYNY